MIQHLPAILIIVGTLAVYAFYALFVVAGVVMAINACSTCRTNCFSVLLEVRE